MRRSLRIASLLLGALASSLVAQDGPAIGGIGPSGTGFFTQELPAGFRIQGVNPPAWRVPGGAGQGPLPKATIFRTPQSKRLADRLQANKQARLSRSAQHRASLTTRRNTRTGASWDLLRKRRSRQEGAKYTPEGRIAPDPTLPARKSRPGLRSAKPAETVPDETPDVLKEKNAYIANWHAERAERRKLQEQALARVLNRQRERVDRTAKAERQATRRYGLSGGTLRTP